MDGMDNMDDMDDMDDMGDMNSMTMYFSTSNPTYLLFKSWKIDSDVDLILSCVGTFLLACLYELFKEMRTMWNQGYFSGRSSLNYRSDPGTGDCCNGSENTFPDPQGSFWMRHIFQSILQIIQVFLAFVLMLIVMTYNAWLTISLCVGGGIGYFISGIIRHSINSKLRKRAERKSLNSVSLQAQELPETNKQHRYRGYPLVYDNYETSLNYNDY